LKTTVHITPNLYPPSNIQKANLVKNSTWRGPSTSLACDQKIDNNRTALRRKKF